jgi:hypothetical protein
MHAGGRPKWKPTPSDRKVAIALASVGIAQTEIAAALRISPMTLRKHLRPELDGAAQRANAAVITSMHHMATSGPISGVKYAAAQFWLKSRLGWREPARLEIIRPVSEMSEEELIARLELDDPERRQGSVVNFPGNR